VSAPLFPEDSMKAICISWSVRIMKGELILYKAKTRLTMATNCTNHENMAVGLVHQYFPKGHGLTPVR